MVEVIVDGRPDVPVVVPPPAAVRPVSPAAVALPPSPAPSVRSLVRAREPDEDDLAAMRVALGVAHDPGAPPPAYNPDPLAPYNIFPGNFPDFPTWRRVLVNLPLPPIPVGDVARICVWDAIGETIGVPPLLCLANFMAALPEGDRLNFIDGTVMLAALPQVLAHFGFGVSVHVTTPNRYSNPLWPPRIQQAAALTWPTTTMRLVNGRAGLHLEVGEPLWDQALIADNPLPQRADIRLDSIRVPFADVGANAQIPIRIWLSVYQRMAGHLANVAAIASGIAGAIRALPDYVAIEMRNVQPEVVRYRVDQRSREQAIYLARDLKLYPHVLNVRDEDPGKITHGLVHFAKMAEAHEIELVMLSGSPGSGKSHWLRRQVAGWCREGPVRFHTWNQILRPQIMQAFTPLLDYVDDRTFASGMVPLFQPTSGTLVLDDAGMLYPGMIPLIILTSPGLRRLVVTFDSSQTQPPFPEANSLSRTLPSTAEWLNDLSHEYALVSRRCSMEVSQLLGLPRALEPGNQVRHGAIYIVAAPPNHVPLLVTSPRFAESKSKGGTPTFAISEAQGLDVVGDIAIDLGGLSNSITDNLMWMALTRCTGSIFLVLPGSAPATSANTLVESSYGCSLIASAILAVAANAQTAMVLPHHDPLRLIARAVQAHLRNSLSAGACEQLGLGGGNFQTIAGNPNRIMRDPGSSNAATGSYHPSIHRTFALGEAEQGRGVQGDWLPNPGYTPRVHGEEGRRAKIRDALRHRVPVHEETAISAPRVEHVPVPAPVATTSADPVLGHHPERFALERERFEPTTGLTQQFNPGRSPLGLHHQRKDAATERISLTERIHPKVALTRKSHRNDARSLFRGLRQFVDLSSTHLDHGLLAQCFDDRLQSWAGRRTVRQILMSVQNAPVDWHPLFVKLFLKSQRVKKLEKMHGKATKGQIVTDMSHAKLFQDDVWALYIERMLIRRKKKSVYLHARETFRSMSHWYKTFWDPSVDVTYCDYTGWDTGVDESFTELYKQVHLAFGVPPSVAERLATQRNELKSFMGPMPAMQASGDRFTWLHNTIGNMAVTSLSFPSFSRQPDIPICFSGDDMIVCGDHKFVGHSAARRFQPKVSTRPRGEFCGYMFGGPQLYISSTVLSVRGQMALEDGRRDVAFWDSYDLSLRYADSGDFLRDATLDLAAQISFDARRAFNLPASKFPLDHDPDGSRLRHPFVPGLLSDRTL